ncbi:hypothetical protein SRB5_68910 [Streptomyces sp. RB5]|uniref:Uncharacterized protein n=1 Tax=Streptomyces smaragdinus TaxID=2585196 RepID=A0A7K0CT93_9ACTN|nr:hypothetical protein [Streptomyces smaragdinus]
MELVVIKELFGPRPYRRHRHRVRPRPAPPPTRCHRPPRQRPPQPPSGPPASPTKATNHRSARHPSADVAVNYCRQEPRSPPQDVPRGGLLSFALIHRALIEAAIKNYLFARRSGHGNPLPPPFPFTSRASVHLFNTEQIIRLREGDKTAVDFREEDFEAGSQCDLKSTQSTLDEIPEDQSSNQVVHPPYRPVRAGQGEIFLKLLYVSLPRSQKTGKGNTPLTREVDDHPLQCAKIIGGHSSRNPGQVRISHDGHGFPSEPG